MLKTILEFATSGGGLLVIFVLGIQFIAQRVGK